METCFECDRPLSPDEEVLGGICSGCYDDDEWMDYDEWIDELSEPLAEYAPC